MALSSEIRRSPQYIGTGTEKTFTFSFKLLKPEDVDVRVALDGAEEESLETSEYSVVLNSNQDNSPGGTVTLVSPLAQGAVLVIVSATPYIQPSVYTNRGGFYPEQLNTNLDRLTILTQQLKEQSERTLVVPVTSADTPTQVMTRLLVAQEEATVK